MIKGGHICRHTGRIFKYNLLRFRQFERFQIVGTAIDFNYSGRIGRI